MHISIKKILYAVIIATLALAFTGCGMKEETGDKLRDLDFTVVGENEQPDALKSIIAEKAGSAFQISSPAANFRL